MGKHTPGPWDRNIRANGKYPVIFAGRNTHVAVARGHGELSGDEIEANIDLIAAAPELFEHCKKLAQWVEHLQMFFGDSVIAPNGAAMGAVADARATLARIAQDNDQD